MTTQGIIALAAGGTGGHMFPAEALAQELSRRGRPVMLFTDERGARYAQNFPAEERVLLSAASPSVGGPIAKAAAAFSLAGGVLTALRAFARHNIAAAVGFGGYPSFPAMKAAALRGVPFGLHEQNGVFGRANRLAAPGARFIAHAFPQLDRVPERLRGLLVEVGNPVRDAVIAAAAAYEPPQNGQPIRVLVFGGSQGATLFSRVAPAAIASLPQAMRARLHVVHQAREADRAAVEAAYAGAGVRAETAPFFADLPARMAAAHLVIARAGASSVTELSVIGRPSILVPLAIAMDDHQTGNARALGDGAIIIAEEAFTAERLAIALHDALADGALLAHMAQSARGRVRVGAAAALADLVEKAVDEKRAAA